MSNGSGYERFSEDQTRLAGWYLMKETRGINNRESLVALAEQSLEAKQGEELLVCCGMSPPEPAP